MTNNDFEQAAWEAFQSAAAEKYDFATCQRADGTYYGTGGTCRKGSEVKGGVSKKEKNIASMRAKDLKRRGASQSDSDFRTRPKAAIEADMKKLTSSGAMQQKGQAGIDARKKFTDLKAERSKPLKGANSKSGGGVAQAPAPPKSAMTKKDPVANVQKQQKETAALKKQMDKDVTAKAKAGKIKGVSKADVDRIQAKKSGGTQLDKASRNEYAKQAKREQQSIKDIKADMKKNGKTPEMEKKLKQAEARAAKFDKFAKTGIFTK